MTRKKRVLVLVADYGYGHRSSALAMEKAFGINYAKQVKVEIVNPLDDEKAPSFFKKDQKNYDRLIRKMPDLYEWGYKVGSHKVGQNLIGGTMAVLLSDALEGIMQKFDPDVVVCPYPFYGGILEKLFEKGLKRVPIVTVVTDWGEVPKLWFFEEVSLCLVPSKKSAQLAIESGVSRHKIKIVGIPIDPKISKVPEKRGNDFVVLAIGSRRTPNMFKAITALNESTLPITLVVACGGDEQLYESLLELDWKIKHKVWLFVPDMDKKYGMADCVLGKAGGLTVAESLGCGRPLIMIDVIAGQETGNAKLVKENKAGDVAIEAEGVVNILSRWLENNKKEFLKRKLAAIKMGKPKAAFETADNIWKLL